MVAREVSFEYLNRQLVWHAFTEFLLFILPVVKVGRWRRWYARFVRKARSLGSSEDSSILKNRKGELSFLPEKTCAICFKEASADAGEGRDGASSSTDITNPYEAIPCGHLYCYICVTSKISLEEGEGWECLRCNSLIKKCRPWKGGLGEDYADEVGPGSSKKVGFENDGEQGRGDEGEEGGEGETARRESIVDEEDLAKLTETLVDEIDDDNINNYRHDSPFSSVRRHSSESASGSGSEVAGPLGESYDNIERPPAVAVTYGSEAESDHTERGGPRGEYLLHDSAASSRARSPLRWEAVEDDEEHDDQDSMLQPPSRADLGDHDSVYDTAGEEDN